MTCSPSCRLCVLVFCIAVSPNSVSKAAVPFSMKSIKPAHGDRVSTRRRATLKRTGSSTESPRGAATPKRKRPSQSKAGSVSKKIACVSCGQADVPLMMGGRKFHCVTQLS